MQIIEAQQQHWQSITELVSDQQELFTISPKATYPWDLAQMQLLFTERVGHRVCVVDDRVVAYANLYDVETGHKAFIGNVIVANNYKGQGIGKQLVEYMIQLCQTTYLAQPHLSVFAFNDPALLMYSKLGFKPYQIEARTALNGEQVALIHMHL